MSEKVVGIHGATPTSGEPRAGVVEQLEEMLEMARSGEVQAIAFAYLYRDGTGSWRAAGLTQSYSLVGALCRLKQVILRNLEEAGA